MNAESFVGPEAAQARPEWAMLMWGRCMAPWAILSIGQEGILQYADPT